MRTESVTSLNLHTSIKEEWTVTIAYRKEFKDWTVLGTEAHIKGLQVPALGPSSHKSLAKAREKAAWLLATLTSSLEAKWPYGATSVYSS